MITDPDAIETIIALNEIKPGDRIKIGERRKALRTSYNPCHDGEVVTVTNHQYSMYDTDILFRVHPDHIVGWQRGE